MPGDERDPLETLFADEFVELARQPRIKIEIDHPAAVALVATVNLALKHPGFPGALRPMMEEFARGLGEHVALSRKARQVLEDVRGTSRNEPRH